LAELLPRPWGDSATTSGHIYVLLCGKGKPACKDKQIKKEDGVGAIARDHEGKMLASMCSSKPNIFYPTIAGAFAV
jgi:hypothetical protein